MNQKFPIGVTLKDLEMHRDDRGVFTEVFRQSWFTENQAVQFNAVRSEPGVLRGVHVHIKHSDHLILPQGQALFALCDIRPGSPTEGMVSQVEMTEEKLQLLTIPPGVAHGFYFYKPSLHIYSVTEYWDLEDELGCRWDDTDLGINWPNSSPKISKRDETLGKLSDLKKILPAWKELD